MEIARDWYNREIAHLGIPLDETFTDSARSAYKGEHVGKNGDLGRFLAAIQSGAVAKGSILIAENLDRICRQGPKIARVLLARIVDNGVEVHIVNIGKKLTYGWENRTEDSVVVDMELSRAFKESERKSVIISAGLESVKHSDDWCGILPFWLKKVYEQGEPSSNGKKTEKPKYKIVVIPEQEKLVREIFSLAANGLGAKRILQTLKAQGIKCSISLGTCGSLLRDRAVLGEHQPHRYLESGRVIDTYFRVDPETGKHLIYPIRQRLMEELGMCSKTASLYLKKANLPFAQLRPETPSPSPEAVPAKKGRKVLTEEQQAVTCYGI